MTQPKYDGRNHPSSSGGDDKELYSRSDHQINTESFNHRHNTVRNERHPMPEQSAPSHPTKQKAKYSKKSRQQAYYAAAARARRDAVSAAVAQKRKKAFIRRLIAVTCVLALLVGVVTLISSSGIFDEDEPTFTQAEPYEKTELQVGLNGSSSAAPTPSEVSEEEESKMPKYEFTRSFTVNTDRLTDKQKNTLKKKLTSEFIVLYDMTSDEILYEKNGTKILYPASTTKILTAIVASKIITDPKKMITVGDEIELIGEDSSVAGLEQGMKLPFEALLDALLLPSGNDAAYTIAVNCARIYADDNSLSNEEAVTLFMELVNDCAKRLGAEDTHFVTPDGWHDESHYTTAENLARFAAYAKTVPIVKKACAKPYASWELDDGRILEWENSNKLILSGSELYSEYCDGMKTGFTDEAGSSVVASATVGGHTLIAVVMNGETLYTKYNDANYLFKEGFKANSLTYTYGFGEESEELYEEEDEDESESPDEEDPESDTESIDEEISVDSESPESIAENSEPVDTSEITSQTIEDSENSENSNESSAN